jgi:hypothetical protein
MRRSQRTRDSGTCSTGILTLTRRSNSERRVRISGIRETIRNPERLNSTVRNGILLKLREKNIKVSRMT